MAHRRFRQSDTSRDNGMVGGVQGYGAEERGGEGEADRDREGARFYQAAMRRRAEEREPSSERGEGLRRWWRDRGRTDQEYERSDWRGRGEGWRGGDRWGRGEDWRGGEHRYGRGDDFGGERWGRDEGWRGADPEGQYGGRFERGRAGFEDFGTPSYGQGRELRERYSGRDFEGRDDRYAGRSGLGYGGEDARERRRRLWEREPAVARDVMTANPRGVRREASLREVAQIMRDENCGVVPVVDETQRLVGVITDRDLVMRTIDEERPWSARRAGEVMTDEVDAVTPETSVRDIIHVMGRRQIRRVPVVDAHDRLLGLISMADVATRANEDEELQEALDRISKRRSFWSRLWT